jgi:hypothetical protein
LESSEKLLHALLITWIFPEISFGTIRLLCALKFL